MPYNMNVYLLFACIPIEQVLTNSVSLKLKLSYKCQDCQARNTNDENIARWDLGPRSFLRTMPAYASSLEPGGPRRGMGRTGAKTDVKMVWVAAWPARRLINCDGQLLQLQW